jgi:hypothetical protein
MTSHESAIEAAQKVFHEELLGTISTDDLSKVISAYLKEMGSDAVAWIWEHAAYGKELMFNAPRETIDARGWAGRPLFLAPSEDIEKLKAERDEARLSAQTVGDELGNQIERLLRRAVADESERDAKAALLESVRMVLEPLAYVADLEPRAQPLDSVIINIDLLRAAKSFLARLEQSDAEK